MSYLHGGKQGELLSDGGQNLLILGTVQDLRCCQHIVEELEDNLVVHRYTRIQGGTPTLATVLRRFTRTDDEVGKGGMLLQGLRIESCCL